MYLQFKYVFADCLNYEINASLLPFLAHLYPHATRKKIMLIERKRIIPMGYFTANDNINISAPAYIIIIIMYFLNIS